MRIGALLCFLSSGRNTTREGALTELKTFGIDISSWSGAIDWKKVIETLNPRFAFVQAYHVDKDSQSSRANPHFVNYWSALEQLKLARGAYLYCHPRADADASVCNFFSVYQPQVGDILPTLDIEDVYDNGCGVPVKDRIAQIDRMVQLISRRIDGQKPIIYTKARVWKDLGNPTQFSGCPLWVIDYQSDPKEPHLPETWTKYAFWQYQRDLTVEGIQGKYDADYFNGDENAMDAITVKRVTPSLSSKA
jgi:lysozyme